MTATAKTESPANASMAQRVLGAAVAAIGGVALAVQGRINGELGHAMGDGLFAAVISFGIGLIVLVVMVSALPAARAGVPRLRAGLRARRLRPWELLGGTCGAFIVASQGITIAAIGVAVFTVAVVAGQTMSSLVVDRAGIGPGGPQPITLPRAAGALLAMVAVVVAVSTKFGNPTGLWLAVLPALAGVGLAWQIAVNGLVRVESDSVLVATLVNFAVGTTALVLACAVDLLARGLPTAPPGQWWLYLGGPLGIVAIGTVVTAVRVIGVLVVGLGSVAGQLLGAVVLDLVVPTNGGRLSVASVVGTAITMVAVGVAALRVRQR